MDTNDSRYMHTIGIEIRIVITRLCLKRETLLQIMARYRDHQFYACIGFTYNGSCLYSSCHPRCDAFGYTPSISGSIA